MKRVLVMLLCFLTGCVEIYGQRTLKMRVVDAETGAPVPKAVLIRDYLKNHDAFNNPEDEVFVMDERGECVARVAVFARTWVLDARGYAPRGDYVGRCDESTGEVVLEVYKLPNPLYRIVMERGYRGPVYVKFDRRKDRPALGQRVFEGKMTPMGGVCLPSYSMFREHWWSRRRNAGIEFVSLADGQPFEPEIAGRFEREDCCFLYIGNPESFADWLGANGFSSEGVYGQWSHLEHLFKRAMEED